VDLIKLQSARPGRSAAILPPAARGLILVPDCGP
jgi:hypothetical protein